MEFLKIWKKIEKNIYQKWDSNLLSYLLLDPLFIRASFRFATSEPPNADDVSEIERVDPLSKTFALKKLHFFMSISIWNRILMLSPIKVCKSNNSIQKKDLNATKDHFAQKALIIWHKKVYLFCYFFANFG